MIAIREQQASRSPRAISMDARQTAKRTFEPGTDDLHPWQRHPNRYDVHGVDSRTGTVLVNRWRCSILKDGKRVLTDTSHFIEKDAQRIVDQTNKHYPEMKATLVCDAGPLKNWNPESTPPESKKAKLEPTKPAGFQADPTLIDRDLAMRAHSGTSWNPKERGKMEIKSFVEDVEHVRKTLIQSTESAEELAIVDRGMDKFQKGYAQKWNARMAAHSSCFSSMIAGPSKFPARKAEKASKAYDKRSAETTEYKERAITAITKKLKDHRISAGGGEIAMMEKKLASAEDDQARMKAVNKILRSKKTSDEDKAKRVHEELGLPEQLIHNLMTPDYGRPGYPAYKLTNNNANIKRMKERVKEMNAREDTPTTETMFAGGTITDNNEDDRVQILYDGRPSPDMIKQLKGSGWRWAPSLGVWQRKRTPAAMTSAKQITGLQ